MHLPEWLPEVSRPYDPDKAAVWDRMTPAERRASWLADMKLGGFCLLFVLILMVAA